MKIIVLSSKECADKNANNGDCFIIDNGKDLVVYDCGCEDYAKWIESYMKDHNYSKVKIVLSHNDDDHFKGIPYLADKEYVSDITTVLLLKYKDELLDKIDDGRKNRDSIGKQITEIYDNIAQLSGCNLRDAFIEKDISEGIKLLGPDKDYILTAAAKGLDGRESDRIDGETVTNATSIHLCIELENGKILLTGDSTFESVNQEKLKEFAIIQLPHHGKAELAEQIFEELKDHPRTQYVISDNTGNSNGGSDKLDTLSYEVHNTKNSGNLELSEQTIKRMNVTSGAWSNNDVYTM